MSEPSDEILKGLNPSQKEAVTWGNLPLLVLAGAGSGKTRILTHRIAYFIGQGIPAFNILGVTFTNKAAQEMKQRVERLTYQNVWVSTFHSTCLRILRLDGAAIQIDANFSIYDESDQLTLIKECMKELNLHEKYAHPKGIRESIQRAKDFLQTPYQFAERAEDMFEEITAKVYELYERKMTHLKACDFGDLIMKTVLLFDRVPEVLARWQERFKFILIDEYQDTNHAQYRFVKLLAQKFRQITVVGDPDQSIYAWRGADIKNILNFEHDYPDCGMIKMEQNYRSTGTILDAANELIRNNRTRKPKDLWTDREEGERIKVFEARNEKEEAEFIIQSIQQNLSAGRTLAEHVIFYRVHAQSRIMEDVLRRHNLPYKIVGGVRFYDRKEIKDLVAYLKVIAYPHDDISLKRILNVPTRGIGKKAMEILEAYCIRQRAYFDESLKQTEKLEGLTAKAKGSIHRFALWLKKIRQEYGAMTVTDLLHAVLEQTGYVAALEAERTIEAGSRIENIEEFFSVIADFEERMAHSGESASLAAFLESISLMTDLDSLDQGTNVLTLMTLHTAKGLEFPIVFMTGLEEGIFPNGNAMSQDVHEIEEERRLCYVGVTRAKEQLYLTYARERRLYGSQHYNLPSRFLTEIPTETLHFIRRTASSLSYRQTEQDELDVIQDDEGIDIEFD